MPRVSREVVFVDGVRTPFGKAGSMYAETRADDLVVNCIRELVRRHPELPPERIDEVAIAATTQTGDQGLTIGRTAALLAGLPRSVPGFAIDRMCAGRHDRRHHASPRGSPSAPTTWPSPAGVEHMGAPPDGRRHRPQPADRGREAGRRSPRW